MDNIKKIKSVVLPEGELKVVGEGKQFFLIFNETTIYYSKNYSKISELFDEYLRKMW